METCPQHPETTPQRRGTRQRKDGTVVVRYWCPAGGHSLSEAEAAPPQRQPRTDRARRQAIRCPNPWHADATVWKRGTRTTKSGTWQRYQCSRPDGSSHFFQTLTAAGGSMVVSIAPPPACPEHPGSKVIRKGRHFRKKTKTATSTRQRYLCMPADGTPAHRFTPPLGRDVVEVGADSCGECEELLSVHRGGQGVARGSQHPLKAVVATLSDLSAGVSYAQASIDLHRRTAAATAHRRGHHHGWLDAVGTAGTLNLPDHAENSTSFAARRAKNAWRLAADITEQYSPVLWNHLNARITARETAQRNLNDTVLAANPNAVLADPLVWILDELPVVVHRAPKAATRYQTSRWHLLVVSEVRWHHHSNNGFDHPPMRDARLRLVRAYPGASTAAWQLVLDELAVRPDFIISDFAAAIGKAIAAQYPPGAVGHIPSFFHAARNLRAALADQPSATVVRNGTREVAEPFEKLLDALTRADLVAGGAAGWAQWWRDFTTTLAEHHIPPAAFAEQQRIYTKSMAAAFDLLADNPHLPASNAAVETAIRLKLEPLLVGRAQRYRNLARINALLDLVVVRDQGLFVDTDVVAGLLREDNTAHGGWAAKARDICDIHPPRDSRTTTAPYSSLLDPFLTEALYAHRKASQ